MTSLLRKAIIITGASSGLGAASAIELAKYSPRLVLHGRNEKALSDVKQKCLDHGLRADDVAVVTGDITEEKTIRKIVQTAKDVFGTLHVVTWGKFNSGIGIYGQLQFQFRNGI
ncbi:hypothetical protein LSH36_50g02012 [Paralvinella palmiformis]|uniref:Uncharacterized protein n=1 Tax=Paralvinella palmiformis TaxID=53620 RepID=A0AAD9K607_9ANNE|nr:hypothetical protein LSH36_50g02012 [Paralvinella palmiformis]